ncbi:hypothetical protein ATCC90586_002812 [Pythium insidiosum]|nr:hypothetical protein ATCC90586_002812 [Pythium insidiosum]
MATMQRSVLSLSLLLLALTALVAPHAANASEPAVTSAATAVEPIEDDPFTLEDKKALCDKDFDGYNQALRLLTVTPEVRQPTPKGKGGQYPRILCYVITVAKYLSARAQAVADTWGQRCDHLIFFSDVPDTVYVAKGTSRERKFEVIKVDANADYEHLWERQKAILTYVHQHYRHDFDWFYKADDDTYLFVENLRQYVRRPEIMMNYHRHPLQLGHRYNITASYINYFFPNEKVRDAWWQRWDRLVFNSGGPGYAMNRLYLDHFVASIPEKHCLSHSGTFPEDVAVALCMMWHEGYPWDTRDLRGRDRWHAFNPRDAYTSSPDRASDWWIAYHQGIGGLRWGDDCCAPDTVGFHYAKPDGMYHIERQLYFCRSGDDVPNLSTYNRKYNLALSSNVSASPP